MKIRWYRRSGERVSAQYIAEAHKHAVHAKRYGYPKSPHAPPGMSAQPTIADALEKMSDWEWTTETGVFVGKRIE